MGVLQGVMEQSSVHSRAGSVSVVCTTRASVAKSEQPEREKQAISSRIASPSSVRKSISRTAEMPLKAGAENESNLPCVVASKEFSRTALSQRSSQK
jgi:hypothetical protein